MDRPTTIAAPRKKAAVRSGKRPILEVKNITKEFLVGDEPYKAVRGITATIYEGEFAIISGPSGSGKSTFLNMLIGLEPPSTGEISIEGVRIDHLDDDQRAEIRSKSIGVVSQQPIWVRALTVKENVAMPMIIANHSPREASVKAEEALFRTGISSHMLHKPTQLSGGQQQRVNFARSLVNDPRILVLDEPTGNLDTKSADEVIGLLKQFNKEKRRTIIMVTHNLEYLSLADRILKIRDGILEDDVTQQT